MLRAFSKCIIRLLLCSKKELCCDQIEFPTCSYVMVSKSEYMASGLADG